MKRKTAESFALKGTPAECHFYAEAEYADSIFRDARGDREGSIMALKRALEAMPTYAPAILSMGSILYQLGRIAEGRQLFQSLLSLPKNTTDIRQILDEAGVFFTKSGAHQEAMAFYQAAVKRYPDVSALFQGVGYCASIMPVCTKKRCPRISRQWSWNGESEVGQRPRLDSLTGRPHPPSQGDPRTGRLDGPER